MEITAPKTFSEIGDRDGQLALTNKRRRLNSTENQVVFPLSQVTDVNDRNDTSTLKNDLDLSDAQGGSVQNLAGVNTEFVDDAFEISRDEVGFTKTQVICSYWGDVFRL